MKMEIELTQSHLWLVLRALAMLTSRSGEAILTAEYPEIDFEEMSREVMALCEQIEAKTPPDWQKKL